MRNAVAVVGFELCYVTGTVTVTARGLRPGPVWLGEVGGARKHLSWDNCELPCCCCYELAGLRKKESCWAVRAAAEEIHIRIQGCVCLGCSWHVPWLYRWWLHLPVTRWVECMLVAAKWEWVYFLLLALCEFVCVKRACHRWAVTVDRKGCRV